MNPTVHLLLCFALISCTHTAASRQQRFLPSTPTSKSNYSAQTRIPSASRSHVGESSEGTRA